MPHQGDPLAALAPHVLPFGGGWTVWRKLRVKSAGFPAAQIQQLATPAAAAAVDALLEREETLITAHGRAIDLGASLLRERGGGARKELARALERLRSGRLPDVEFASGAFADAVAQLRYLHASWEDQRQEVVRQIVGDGMRAAKALRALAGEDRFREAIAWQNRAVLAGGFASLARRPVGMSDAKTREHERLAASYLQRYYVKNDTIGFFGPVGWADFVERHEHVRFRPGPTLFNGSASVHFEYWCIDLLAQKLAEDPEIRPFLAPRSVPFIRLDGNTLKCPIECSVEVAPEVARLIALCDGQRSAQAIARKLVAACDLDLSSEGEVYDLLSDLVAQRLVLWSLEIPTTQPHPERYLQRMLERLPETSGRARALAVLAELEKGREAVEAACGDSCEVERCIGELEEIYSRVAGAPASRRHGETYAARGLIYLDCRRDMCLELGAGFRERLAPPLSLLLESARWFTFTVAARYRQQLEELYQSLRNATGDTAVDYLRFWRHAERLFNAQQNEKSTIVSEVSSELALRWARLLEIEPGARRIERSVAHIRERVADDFAAPHPGWPGARYHSPDILVAARGLDAFQRGDYLAVIGELHIGANTLLPLFALQQHPRARDLLRARMIDLSVPSVVPVESKTSTTRADHLSLAAHDISLEIGISRSWRPREQTLQVADLVIDLNGPHLVVRTRNGRRTFDIIAFLEQYLIFACLGHFALLPRARHTPRVSLDGVVIHRETWQFRPDEIPFARLGAGPDRFVDARRWARRHGLPRHVFIKVPEEPKPCFIDLASPIYIELLAKMARKGSSVTVSEMLPALDELWLTDAHGSLYTCELRVAAVDPQPWSTPLVAVNAEGVSSLPRSAPGPS